MPDVTAQPVLDPSTAKATGRPEEAVADGAYEPPGKPFAGAVNVIVWAALATVKNCCACAAGR